MSATLALFAGGAGASERVLAPVGNDSALSAYGGWVVWSEFTASGRWALTGWHDGRTLRLPVATREVPFDADVGPDLHGTPVITYSRCDQEPLGGSGFVSPNGLPVWSQAGGCRIYELNPATGRTRRLHVPGERGDSDTTPSRWRGSLAFARTRDNAQESRVLIWSLRSGRLRQLRRGDFPRGCGSTAGCSANDPVGAVQQLDLGARVAAFLWQVQAPAVSGVGPGWELFSDTLSDGRRALLASGASSGTCGAGHPVSPNADGLNVWFDSVVFECDTPHSYLSRGNSGSGAVRRSETAPVTWQLAHASDGLYEIRGPWSNASEMSNDPPCIGVSGPCQLVFDSRPTPPTGLQPTAQPPFVTP